MATYDISALGSALEYDTTDGTTPSIAYLTSTRFVAVWSRAGTLKAQCFDINRGTGAISTAGSSTLSGYSVVNRLIVVALSSTKAVIFMNSTEPYAQEITIDGSGNISEGSQQNLDSTNNVYVDAVVLDSTHILYTFANGTDIGKARVLSLSGGTFTLHGSDFQYEATNCEYPSLSLISTSKCLVSYVGGSSDGFCRVLSIDGSYNVTGAASSFEFYDASTLNNTNSVIIDSTSSPILAASLYTASAGATTGRILQGLKIDSSAFTVSNFVTTVRNQLDSYTTTAGMIKALFRIDATHVIAFYEFTGTDGRAQTLSINTTSGASSSLSTTTFDTTQAKDVTALDMGSGLFVAAWAGSANDGYMQAFQVTMPSTDYPITAAQGSFTLTGQNVLYHLGRKMIAAQGSFTLTGIAAVVKASLKMAAVAGSFTLTGVDAAFRFGKYLAAAFGSFTLTGQAVGLTSTRKIIAEAGSYVWTGFATSLHIGFAFLAAMGTFTYTGFSTAFSGARKIVAAAGTFTLTGQAVAFVRAALLTAVTGYFTLTGGVVRFLKNGTSVVLINIAKVSASLTNAVKAAATSLTNRSKQ